MKHTLLLLSILLTGCVSVPSTYDDNESKQITDIYYAVDGIECGSHFVKSQINRAHEELKWMFLYIELSGSNDVKDLLIKSKHTLDTMTKLENKSDMFCSINKKLLKTQIKSIGKAIHGRF